MNFLKLVVKPVLEEFLIGLVFLLTGSFVAGLTYRFVVVTWDYATDIPLTFGSVLIAILAGKFLVTMAFGVALLMAFMAAASVVYSLKSFFGLPKTARVKWDYYWDRKILDRTTKALP